MKNFLQQWIAWLEKDKEAALAILVNGIGSRPRENGAQMLIARSGRIYDTIGGGRLEADVIQCAQNVLAAKHSTLYHFSLTGKDAAGADMICGGQGDVFVYYSEGQDLSQLNAWQEKQFPDGWILFPMADRQPIRFMASQELVQGYDNEFVARINSGNQEVFIIESGNTRCLFKKITTSGKLHLMGAGHVSCEIAKIAHLAGIECAVYDDRSEFVNQSRFPNAQRVLIKNMSHPPDIEINHKDMIAIVTRGHLHDMANLEWALHTRAGYIGMIGSKRKSGLIFSQLKNKGFSPDKLKQVFAPIGLDIGAETPAEIAVAVVAQLIEFKRKGI